MREPNPKFDLSRSAERTSGELTLEEVLDELALARAMLAHSTSGFTLLDADGTLLYEHPNNEAITGYPVSESTGKNLFDFCHPSDAERLLPRLERLARSPGAPLEVLPRGLLGPLFRALIPLLLIPAHIVQLKFISSQGGRT